LNVAYTLAASTAAPSSLSGAAPSSLSAKVDAFVLKYEALWVQHIAEHSAGLAAELASLTPAQNASFYQTFEKNMDEIILHNQQYIKGIVTYLRERNHLTHLTPSQVENTYMGLIFDDAQKAMHDALVSSTSKRQSASAPAPSNPSQQNAPQGTENAVIDWSATPFMQPVKNQQQCGSCWAFASACVMETMAAIQLNMSVSLSEQDIVDCSFGSPAGNGCDGGDPLSLFQWAQNNAIGSENPYGYVSANGGDQTGFVQACQKNLISQSPFQVTATQSNGYNTEQAIIAALANGPVAVAIDASSNDFSSYSSGVFSSPSCAQPDGSGSCNADHAVTVVGYGTYTLPNGSQVPYWKVRNSWGANWGYNGYILMQRGVNMCCIELYAAQTNVNAQYFSSITTTSTLNPLPQVVPAGGGGGAVGPVAPSK